MKFSAMPACAGLPGTEAGSRRLPAWALGASLAVHLALLAWPFLQREARFADLPPLAVSFRSSLALAPTADNAPAQPRRAPPAAPAPAGAHSRMQRAAPVAEPAPVAVADSATAVPAVSVAERKPALPVHAAASTNPAAMARYVRLLGDLLAREQQYPRLAAVRGWEGEVRLRLQMAHKGTVIAVHIVNSSGFDVLDENAVQLVQNTTLPPPPATDSPSYSPAGSTPDFLIDIPIHYSLKRS